MIENDSIKLEHNSCNPLIESDLQAEFTNINQEYFLNNLKDQASSSIDKPKTCTKLSVTEVEGENNALSGNHFKKYSKEYNCVMSGRPRPKMEVAR